MRASLQLVRQRRAELDRLVLPGGVERREIDRVGVGQCQQRRRLRRRFGLTEDSAISARNTASYGDLPLAQAFGQRRENMRRLASISHASACGRVDEKFEEQRQEIRQLVRRRWRGHVLSYMVLQIDHGLAAVAAFAMHVLEQMQRQRARAVEQQDVALLQVVEIAAGDVVEQTIELPAYAPVPAASASITVAQFANGLPAAPAVG